MQLPPFLDRIKAAMEAWGIPFVALPAAVGVIAVTALLLLFSNRPPVRLFV